MAMTYLEDQKKKQQELQNPQQQTAQPGTYNVQGMSDTTQQQLQKSQAGYQPNEAVQTAQQNMQNVQNMRPQTYNSKYSGALDSILAEIQNPKPFKYSFNDDELFKYYADLETQNAKKANINAQGQAAALTGGYGNSYGAAAGAQAYQEALLPLYERGMQLAQFARDNYDKDQQRPYDQLAALQGMDESDYGRYRDTMSDWRQDEQNARDVYENERNFGYNEYVDALNNALNIGKMESDSFRADQDEAYRRDTFQQSINEFNATNELDWAQLEEKKREYDAGLTEEQRQYDQKVAMQYALAILQNGQIPSNELLVAAGLSYEDAQKLIAKITAGPGKKTTETEKQGGQVTDNGKIASGLMGSDPEQILSYTEADIPPMTGNLDTPVTVRRAGDDTYNMTGVPWGENVPQKTKTQASYDMNPYDYNRMVLDMIEDMYKTKKE